MNENAAAILHNTVIVFGVYTASYNFNRNSR